MPSIVIIGENAHRQRMEYEFFFPSMKCVQDGECEGGEMKFVPSMGTHAFTPKTGEVKEGYENYWVVNLSGLSITPFITELDKDIVMMRIRVFLLSLGENNEEGMDTFILDVTKFWNPETIEYGDTIGIH